jgi:internalin A
LKIPFFEKVAKKVTLKEQVLDSPPQPVITKDNVTMQIDTVIYYAVYDAKLYAYGAVNPISALSNLETLTITDTAVQAEELPVIGSLSKLQNLTLQNCGLSTSAGLENAVNLIYLDLSENTIRNIDALSAMKNLQELNLQNNHAVTDLSKLSSLRALTKLDVSGNMLTTLSPITGLAGLTSIDASENTITDLSKIDQLTALTYLSVAGNELTDVSVLGGCSQLSELDISGNALTDISALSTLQALTKLNFANNQVTQLPKWSSGCALIAIDGSHNQLTSLEPLQGLSNLNNVYMDYNAELSSVACLADCPLLIQVNVFGTKVTSVSMLTEMSVVVNYDPTN